MTSTTVTRAPASGSAVQKKSKKAPFPIEFWRSDLGKKYVMAITGIAIMGFVFFHMLGNLKMYLGPVHFNEYAEWLRELLVPFLPRTVALWIMRIGLIVAFALHILAAYQLTLINRAARTTKYTRRDYIAANFASRTMRWSGIIVGLFLIFHLFDLSWTGTGFTYIRGNAYHNVDESLSRWPVALLYIVANIALGHPPVPRRLEPLPDDGLEQPPLQRVASELRHRLRRCRLHPERLVPHRRARRRHLPVEGRSPC